MTCYMAIKYLEIYIFHFYVNILFEIKLYFLFSDLYLKNMRQFLLKVNESKNKWLTKAIS